MDHVDDIIGNGASNYNFSRHTLDDDERFIFTTMSLPSDPRLMPTLSNGHVGFTIFSDSVYMNALYNGRGGLSHRARIPNFSNIQFADCSQCRYTMNMQYGYFMTEMNIENEFIATHLVYAHRYYNRAIINQYFIQRLGSRDDIRIKINQNPGNVKDNQRPTSEAMATNKSSSNSITKDDIEFTKNETIHFSECDFQLLCGHIMETERLTEEEPIRQEKNVCVIWNHVPEELALEKMASSISYKFVMAVDIYEADVRQEMIDVFSISNDDLLISHIKEWKKFWFDFHIEIDGNDQLLRAFISSVFNIICNLPSENTNLPQQLPFYGLSPTGLSRGGSDLSDYEGHIFWDTEIFMFFPIALINHNWAKNLLHYRYIMLQSARDNAKTTGYKGARFPWESAATGIEVVQPDFEYIGEFQQHISGDISFAMHQYFALTHDVEWVMKEGCEMAIEIAKFWESRVKFNEESGLYDIEHVMGPDEDHNNVTNNVYTNVVAKEALKFGSMIRTFCTNELNHHDANDKWIEIANKIKIIYDVTLDYHPQFEGYKVGTLVKQADAILIGYPLMFPMNESTRRNDLNFYVNCTRKSGPAMSFSMFAINYLDIGDVKYANEMLEKSYKPYVRKPFNVWCETAEGENFASNFISGAGGFLQTIFNGFFGIHIHLDYLEIRKPYLPKGSNRMTVSGLLYLNSKFEITVKQNETVLKFIELKNDLILMIDNENEEEIIENFEYNIVDSSSTIIKSKTKIL
ncbi:hypothetical protein PVAND_004347 [Polypedilum vanderplanki]|uniref:Protein-glucosylgalactosylhydroxylysine glucosidase n=1 Tax=Polypedilum vanderplanki TaxID=319348 RepID=A0A9J6BXV8_POLVA|nr:hypothetical protein PVAND_004347 [Polypedilum vanderplanki]